MIMTNNKNVSFQGCYNQLQSKFESYLYILIGIAAGVGLLQVRVLSHHNSKLHVVLLHIEQVKKFTLYNFKFLTIKVVVVSESLCLNFLLI